MTNASRAPLKPSAGSVLNLHNPHAACSPSSADLFPGEAAASLQTFLAKGAAEGQSGSRSGKPSPAQVREAARCESEGVRQYAEGRMNEAIAALQKAVKLNPAAASALYNLGVALVSAGRLQQAVGPISEALRLDPTRASAKYCLAYIYENLGQSAKALALYQGAVAVKPDLVAAQLRLGELYLAQGLRSESAAAFRAAGKAAKGTLTGDIARAQADDASGASRACARRHRPHRQCASGQRRSAPNRSEAPRRGGISDGGGGALQAPHRAFSGTEAWAGSAWRGAGGSRRTTDRFSRR